MPLYQYLAIAKDGKKTAAEIDAESLQDAKQKLIRLQIIAIKITPLSDKDLKKSLSKKEVLLMTRELSRLLYAGLPLYEGLSALEEKYRGQKTHTTILDLCQQVKTGHPFSKSLSRHANTFDILYTSMVANAEKTGRLGICLNELADLLQRQIQTRKQIVAALLYPSLLAAFCLVVLSSLLFFVIPSMQELFSGRDLHPFTRIVFTASQVACRSKMVLAVMLVGLIGTTIAACRSKTWKKKSVNFLMKIPILKILFAKVAFVRFSRAAATLLEGGLPLITALAQARSVMRHPVLEELIARAEERVGQGDLLSIALKKHPFIPPLVPRMLSIAEQSGKLSFTMQQIAQIYEDELETTLANFAAMAQPVLLLVLGGLVGFILLSVLLPLTDVSTFVN